MVEGESYGLGIKFFYFKKNNSLRDKWLWVLGFKVGVFREWWGLGEVESLYFVYRRFCFLFLDGGNIGLVSLVLIF